MKQQSNSIISKPTQREVLSTFLFILWLFSANFSIAHAQEHSFLEEHNCHLCFLSENSSPETIAHLLAFEFITPVNPEIEDKPSFILCFTCLFLSNRDPPLKTFN